MSVPSFPRRLVLLAVALLGVLYAFAPGLAPEEARLVQRIRAAQGALWAHQEALGLPLSRQDDPERTGFVGVEWSPLTTTLGELPAKRTAANPLFGVQCLRWFRQAGLVPGDRIVLFSSSSFPGLLFSALAAAESAGLEVTLVVSLGSSTWGANRPQFPWPAMGRFLRREGFLRTLPVAYTLGGDYETGGGLSEEGRVLLERVAREDGVPLWTASGTPEQRLRGMTDRKMALIESVHPKLVVSVGGSHANLGDREAVLALQPGLLAPSQGEQAGDGVIGRSLRRGLPVLHLLEMKTLCARTGIGYDAPFRRSLGASPWAAAAGLGLFAGVLASCRRFRFTETQKKNPDS